MLPSRHALPISLEVQIVPAESSNSKVSTVVKTLSETDVADRDRKRGKTEPKQTQGE